MSNTIRNIWKETKERGESIGITFFCLGILVLLTLFALVLAGVQNQIWLLSVSLGLLSIWLGFTAIGMSAKTDKYAQIMLSSLQGTLEEAIRAELDIDRSSQGDYELTELGKDYEIYDSNKSGRKGLTFFFANAWVRLDSMKEGDIVRIRVHVKENGEESQVSIDEENTYSGVQATMAKISGNLYNKEGVRITVAHIGGTSPIKLSYYVYDAKRGG